MVSQPVQQPTHGPAPRGLSIARRRMAVIAASTLLWGTFSSGMEVLLPLWVSDEVGLTAQQWAQLRSLRMTGVLVGILPLGMLTERYGDRALGAVCMVLVAVVLVAWSIGKGVGLWVGMPIYGALVSAAFVNMNTLIQRISDAKQGLANSIYRSVNACAAIFAPVLVTRLAKAWEGYPPVLLAIAGMLIVSAAILTRYPDERPAVTGGGPWAVCVQMWDSCRQAFRNRELMRMIQLTQLWFAAVAAVATFAALRFTQELGVSHRRFGELGAVAGVLTLVGVSCSGLLLDRVSIRKFSILCAVGGAACCLVMGLSDSVLISSIAYVFYPPLHMMLSSPVSMWVSRAAGETSQTSAFSVHKVISAAYSALGVALLGVLESRFGMRTVLLGCGIVGIVIAASFGLLREPPPPRLHSAPQAHPTGPLQPCH